MDLRPGYREAPAHGLACLWVHHADGPRRTRVLPDACADVIWRRGEGAFVAGPDTAAQVTDSAPGDLLLGARLAPGTGAAVLGVPLHAVRDARVPLGGLRPDLAEALPGDLDPLDAAARLRELAIRPRGAGRWPSRAAAAPASAPDALVVAAAQRLREPGARVTAVARDVGVSERQLRRRCEAAVGYGPKQLQRVLRLQRFLRLAEDGDDDLARLALDAGYSDQPHLTNDVVRLSGLPPAALLAERAA